MIEGFDKEEGVVSAEFADYLEGKITFNDLMDILILDLDNVDEIELPFGDLFSKNDFKISF